MICKSCNSEIPNNAVFCPNCGTPVDDLEATGLLVEEDEESTGLLVEEKQNGVSNQKSNDPFNYSTTSSNVNPAFVNPGFQTNSAVNNNSYIQNEPIKTVNSNYVTAGSNTIGKQPTYQNVPTNQPPTIKDCFVKYWQSTAHFNGRSRRSDYWYPVFVNFLIALIASITVIGVPFATIYSIATIAPTLSVLVRRLHDLGKEWYNLFFMLIPFAGPIIILIWLCQDSQVEANEFGPNPKSN